MRAGHAEVRGGMGDAREARLEGLVRSSVDVEVGHSGQRK